MLFVVDGCYHLFIGGYQYLFAVVFYDEECVDGAVVNVDNFADLARFLVVYGESDEVVPCEILLFVHPFAGNVGGAVGEEADAFGAVEVLELDNDCVVVLRA